MVYQKFSPRQKMTMTWWKNPKTRYNEAIICDGSVRSGKTISMAIGFILWITQCFDGETFAICGKTIESIRRNMIRLLPGWLEGTDIHIQERRSENLLTVSGGGHKNTVYLFGGRDESSAALVQGLTLAGVLFDEAALMPRSFVEQAMARCSVSGARLWFNCNPDTPGHWFYQEWIRHKRRHKVLYLHFTMEDNLSLSEAVRERYRSMFSGVFYRRFVLGEWVAAEGAVYDMFDMDTMVRTDEPAAYDRCYVAVDYGNANATAFGLIYARGRGAEAAHYLAREYYHDGRKSGLKTVEQYAADLRRFIADASVSGVIVDPSALAFIAELQQEGFHVIRGRNAVLPGIARCATEFQQGRLLIDPSCKNTVREISGYVWDDKAAARGEDAVVKKDDHCPDMLRYGVYTDYRLHLTGRENLSR